MNIFKSEFLKNKGTGGMRLCLLFVVFIHFVPFFILYWAREHYSQNGYNPWRIWLTFASYPLMFPLFLALITHLCMSIEYKFNGLRQLYTFPTPSTYFYISKFMFLCVQLLIVVMLSYSATMIGCSILKCLVPNFMFEKYDYQHTLHLYYCKLYLQSITIISIQLFLSRLFSNFAIPVIIASFCTILGILLSDSKYIYLNPYGYMQTLDVVDIQKEKNVLYLSFLITLLMLLIGVLFNKYKKTTLI